MLLFLLLLGTGTCAFIIGTATHALPIPELRADPLPSDLDNYVGDEVFVFLFVCLFSFFSFVTSLQSMELAAMSLDIFYKMHLVIFL
jgi:hypothetical protein